MQILILGKGFLGNYLYNFLSKYNDVVHFSKKDLNYLSTSKLKDYLSTNHKRFVINASGFTGYPNVDACEKNKIDCWYYNATVPNIIARACNAISSHMIHISSGCIYNGYDKKYSEEDVPNFGLFNTDSSFYSQSKHAGEEALYAYPVSIFRIRIPFCDKNHPKNYFNKLLKYDKLISVQNSLTSLDDFCVFVHRYILKFSRNEISTGIYNVVNEGSIEARDIISMLAGKGIINPNHEYIKLEDLKTEAKRSNVVLSTDKIKSCNLALPNVRESLEKCIDSFALKIKNEGIK